MPLAVRNVEPRSVCSNPLLTEEATRAGDALQAVAVRSMAGLIRQLGSLARHAESIMGELADSLANCHERTMNLEKRSKALAVDILPNLDPDREVLEGFEIPHPDLQFKSKKTIDQRLLSQKHAPSALLKQYRQAKAPPALNEFDIDWEDGRNAMHLFSKPDFFFQNWRDEIQRQTLKKMSQMDLLSPTHAGKQQRPTAHKQALEHSTGSDKVSSFVRPVKRTFSHSRKPHPQKQSLHGSSQSLDVPGYSTMPSYTGRPGIPRRSSPSFHSVRHYPPPGNKTIMRSQSLRIKVKKRPKLYSLSKATASMYVEQNLGVVMPNRRLEDSTEYEYEVNKPIKRSSSLRRSHSFRKSKSNSPIPPTSTNSVLDTMHMYTVAEEVERRDASPFARLSKRHLECLELGTTSFETCLAIEPPKKEQTTFRTPVGIRQRPISSLDMQLVAMRSDGTAASRSSNLRLKQASTEVVGSDKNHDSLAINGTQGNRTVVTLRKRISLLAGQAHVRPVSASFIDPPTVKKIQEASSLAQLRSHGGSLTDLTRTASPESPLPKVRPKRPAPQPPSRSISRSSSIEASDSGRSTPKEILKSHSPLVARHSYPKSPGSSNDTMTGIGAIQNGRISPNSLMFKNHRTSPIQRNPSSPQLPMIPIQEEEITASHLSHNHIPNKVVVPEITVPLPVMSGPPPYLRRDSLYVSPRKQSLTVESIDNLANTKQLRASQILETGGIVGGDLSSSRLDLLVAIRKGIQLKQVQQKAREKEDLLVSMPWDVAAILERRWALESDTESSEDESNNGDWLDGD